MILQGKFPEKQKGDGRTVFSREVAGPSRRSTSTAFHRFPPLQIRLTNGLISNSEIREHCSVPPQILSNQLQSNGLERNSAP